MDYDRHKEIKSSHSSTPHKDVTSKRDPQRRLNPIMKEVVHAKTVKLLDNEIIYPISDIQWLFGKNKHNNK